MRKFIAMSLLGAMMLLGASEGLAELCGQYLEILRRDLPAEVGNEKALLSLLDVKPLDWVARLDVKGFFDTIRDQDFRATVLPDTLVGTLTTDHSKMFFNLTRGEVRYVNFTRNFDPGKHPPKAIGEEQGLQLVNKLLTSLGIPREEIGGISSNVLNAIAAEPGKIEPAMQMEVERTFFVQRLVSKRHVITSLFAIGINNLGEISRFRVRWPPLRIYEGLKKGVRISSRDDVIRKVHDMMVENEGCVALEQFRAQVLYAPVNDDYQDRDESYEIAKAKEYEPMLAVFYRPRDEAQEQAGQQLLFRLMAPAR